MRLIENENYTKNIVNKLNENVSDKLDSTDLKTLNSESPWRYKETIKKLLKKKYYDIDIDVDDIRYDFITKLETYGMEKKIDSKETLWNILKTTAKELLNNELKNIPEDLAYLICIYLISDNMRDSDYAYFKKHEDFDKDKSIFLKKYNEFINGLGAEAVEGEEMSYDGNVYTPDIYFEKEFKYSKNPNIKEYFKAGWDHDPMIKGSDGYWINVRVNGKPAFKSWFDAFELNNTEKLIKATQELVYELEVKDTNKNFDSKELKNVHCLVRTEKPLRDIRIKNYNEIGAQKGFKVSRVDDNTIEFVGKFDDIAHLVGYKFISPDGGFPKKVKERVIHELLNKNETDFESYKPSMTAQVKWYK